MNLEFYPGQLHCVPQIAFEKEPELEALSKFIDDYEFDTRLAYINDFSTKRGYTPATYIRIHMLRQIRGFASYNKTVAELKTRRAYRKFCFIPSKSKVPCPASLSNFRKKIGENEVKIITHVFINTVKSRMTMSELTVFITDATDLESSSSLKVIDRIKNPQTLKETKIFHDRDVRFGKRSNKKNKSNTFLGYKKHTISMFIPDENISLPLCSIAAPADVHEVTLVQELIKYAKSLDIPVKILSADLGYYDTDRTAEIQEKEGVTLVTGIKSNTILPPDVDDRCAPLCEAGIGMKWDAYDEKTKSHCYICPMENPASCLNYPVCLLEKTVYSNIHPVIFGGIPLSSNLHSHIADVRKYVEGVFARQKNNDNLKDITLKGTKNFQFIFAIADGVNIVKYFYRKEQKTKTRKRPAGSKRRASKETALKQKGAA